MTVVAEGTKLVAADLQAEGNSDLWTLISSDTNTYLTLTILKSEHVKLYTV